MPLRRTSQREATHSVAAKKYEKDRRIRFNALLDRLASVLPGCPVGNPDNKWTKAQIVENAIRHIKSISRSPATNNTNALLEAASSNATVIVGEGPNSNTNVHQKLKLVARQNRRLRELLRLDYAPDMTAKDFCLLNVAQITELINVRKLEVQQNGETSEEGSIPIGGDSAPDVFVAKISSQTDHNYSLIVHNEPEVEVETELETTIPSEANDSNKFRIIPQNSYQMIGVIKNIDAPESNISNTLSSIIGNDETSVTEVSTENIVVQSSSFPITNTNQLQNVKPIAVLTSPVKSYGLPLIATAPSTSTTLVPTLISGTQISQSCTPSIASSSFNHKLPLPKLNASNVNGNKQYTAVMQASAPALLQYSASINPTRQNTGNEPWRLPKKRKRRTKLELKAAAEKALLAEKRKALENKVILPDDTSDDDIVHSQTPPICDDGISVDTENIAKTNFMEVSASSSLPQNILASEEDSVDLSNILNERKSQMTPNEHTSTQKNQTLVEAGIETVDLTGEDEDELRTNLSNTIIQIASTNPIRELSTHGAQITHESTSVEDNPQKDRKTIPKDTRRKEVRTSNDVSNIASETPSKGLPSHSKSSLVSSTGGNKRSKNSYSIAALCQISVNIGGDPSAGAVIVGAPCEGMTVSSPGLISLTSVGTGSPIGTPAPTPTPPISTSAMTNTTLSSTTSQSISLAMSSNQGTCHVPSLLSGNSISGSTEYSKAEKLMSNKNNSMQVLPDTDFPLNMDHNSAAMVAINPKKVIQELSTVSERKTGSSVGSGKGNKMSTNQKYQSKPFGESKTGEISNESERNNKMENDWSDIIDNSDNSQPLSPTKSYLNHFPVVSGNNKNAVNEKKNKNNQLAIPKSNSRRESESSSCKSADNLRSKVSNLKQAKSNPNFGKPKSNVSTPTQQTPSNHSKTNNTAADANTKINPDLSVYDFTEPKQDSSSSTNQSSPPFVSKKTNSATKIKTQLVSSSSESKAHISNSNRSISNVRSKTERVESCNDSSKFAEFKNSSKSNASSSAQYSSESKQNQSSNTICKTSSSQTSKSSVVPLLRDDKVTKTKTGTNTTLAKRDNASQGVAASLSAASAINTGYDLSFARSKPSVHQKEGIVPSNASTIPNAHSYLHGVSSNVEDASIGAKAPQEQPIANVSSFSPAQTFVTSTFAPGVGGSITSLSEFMNHPIQTNYSTTYSQHSFPTSIPQGQFNYHRSSVVSTMTTPTPPNISSYSSTNLYYQSHHSNSNPPHQTQSLASQSASRKNTSLPGREEQQTLNYLPITTKSSPLKSGYINDAGFMSSKSYHLSNAGSTKSGSGGRNYNLDEKNNPQSVSHLQYGAMFASPSSIATSGISNLQQMTNENDPSTLFSVNQLVSQKVGSQGGISSENGSNSSSSIKKSSKRSQNPSSVKQDAIVSNDQGGAKGTKTNKTVSSDSDFSKEGGVNKESSKSISRQIQKDVQLDQGHSEIAIDGPKRQSRSSQNNAHRSGSSSATNRSKSSGQSNIGAGGTKRSYSAESLFSNENVLNASLQRSASSSRQDNSKIPSNANRHQNQPQSSNSGDFVYPGQPMNRDNTNNPSNPSLSRSDYSWLHSSEQSHNQSTTGSNSINSHVFPPLSSTVTAPVAESHSTQMNPIMGSGAPVQTPSPISFVQEFDFPSSVLGSGGVSQTDMISSMIFQPSLSHPSSLTSSTKTSKSQQQSSSHTHKGSFSLTSNSSVSNQAPLSSIASSSTFVARSGNSYSTTITSAGGDANQIDVNPVGHHQQPMMSVTPSIMSDQQQQFGHQYLFDNTNLFPLPTLTPPTSIQMAATSGGPFNMDEPNNHFSHYHGSSSFYGPIPTNSAPNHTQNLLLSSSPTPPTSIPSYNLPIPNSLQPQYQTTLQNVESSQSVHRNTSRTYSSSHHSSSTSSRSYSKSPSKNSVPTTSGLFSASTSTNTNVGGPPQGNSLPQRQQATHAHHIQQLQQSQQQIHHDIPIHQQHQQQMTIPSSPTHPTGMLSTPNAPPIVPIGSQILPQGGLHHSASVGIMSSGSQSSQQAYINFNLSTICPEINAAFVPHITEKLGMLPPSNPLSQPQPPPTHSSIPSQSATSIPTTHNTTKSSSSRSNVSNSGQVGSRGSTNGSTVTSEMVSHNVGVLGHGVSQVGLSNTGFSSGIITTNMMPPSGSMNFQPNDQ